MHPNHAKNTAANPKVYTTKHCDVTDAFCLSTNAPKKLTNYQRSSRPSTNCIPDPTNARSDIACIGASTRSIFPRGICPLREISTIMSLLFMRCCRFCVSGRKPTNRIHLDPFPNMRFPSTEPDASANAPTSHENGKIRISSLTYRNAVYTPTYAMVPFVN